MLIVFTEDTLVGELVRSRGESHELPDGLAGKILASGRGRIPLAAPAEAAELQPGPESADASPGRKRRS